MEQILVANLNLDIDAVLEGVSCAFRDLRARKLAHFSHAGTDLHGETEIYSWQDFSDPDALVRVFDDQLAGLVYIQVKGERDTEAVAAALRAHVDTLGKAELMARAIAEWNEAPGLLIAAALAGAEEDSGRLLGTVEAALQSPSPETKLKALKAAALLADHPGALEMLERAAAREPDPELRRRLELLIDSL